MYQKLADDSELFLSIFSNLMLLWKFKLLGQCCILSSLDENCFWMCNEIWHKSSNHI